MNNLRQKQEAEQFFLAIFPLFRLQKLGIFCSCNIKCLNSFGFTRERADEAAKSSDLFNYEDDNERAGFIMEIRSGPLVTPLALPFRFDVLKPFGEQNFFMNAFESPKAKDIKEN